MRSILFFTIFALVGCSLPKNKIESKPRNSSPSIRTSLDTNVTKPKEGPQCLSSRNHEYYKFLSNRLSDRETVNENMSECLLLKNQPQHALYFYNLSNKKNTELYLGILLRLKRIDLVAAKSEKLSFAQDTLKFIDSLYFFDAQQLNSDNLVQKGWSLIFSGKLKEVKTLVTKLKDSKRELYLKMYYYYLTDNFRYKNLINRIKEFGVGSNERAYLSLFEKGGRR